MITLVSLGSIWRERNQPAMMNGQTKPRQIRLELVALHLLPPVSLAQQEGGLRGGGVPPLRVRTISQVLVELRIQRSFTNSVESVD